MSEPYDRVAREREDDRFSTSGRDEGFADSGPTGDDDLEEARENVLDGWPSSEDVSRFVSGHGSESDESARPSQLSDRLPDPAATPHALDEDDARDEDESESESLAEPQLDELPEPESPLAPLVDPAPVVHAAGEHAPGELDVPPGYNVLEGTPDGSRRAVGIVVSRFNGEFTSRLLQSALDELDSSGVARDAITVMPVPGAFELPIGAMALAKTRRFACIVALGCVIRGDTPHFDFVASEAASGLQLAALETGVPVAFGVLTLERADQAEARLDKGAEAVKTALEMADLFSHLRAAAAR